MTTGAFLFIGGLVFFGGSALAAFYWAMKDRQFHSFSEAAQTIFDHDEPIGTATDQFPEKIRK